MKLSACLIVKNEEEMLERCLKSLEGMDEIIICDTGSTDKTINIATKYGKVFTDYKWNDDFAEARNHANSKATGDWIITIDADERLITPISEVRWACENAKTYALNCEVRGDDDPPEMPGDNSLRVYRNDPKVRWFEKIHNYLSTPNQEDSNIVFSIGYSPAHKQDPDRTLRILKKVHQEKPTHARTLYYLAREYWYRKDYITAIWWFNECLEFSKFRGERADAYMHLAYAYWNMGKWDKSREMALNAIVLNPDFKEPFLWLADVAFPEQGNRFKEIATTCANKDVLFNRKGEEKKKVYYCDGMKTFGEALIKMGYEKYNPETDKYCSTLFEGLYFQEDYEIFKNHKGRREVYWNGSDVLKLLDNPVWQEILKENPAKHTTYDKFYQDKLLSVGIYAWIEPIFFGNKDDFKPCFKSGNEVYMTAHPGREEEYGVPLAIEKCKEYGLKLHIYGISGKSDKNIVYHGQVSEEQMNKEIRKFQGAFKGNKAPGRSQTYLKSKLLGQYPIDINDPDWEEQLKLIKTR